MGARVNIHKTHRTHTDGLDAIEVDGSSVGECLSHLVRRFPGMEKAIFDDKGELHNYVEIYLNHESAYPDELAKPVKDGDEIHVTILLAGG